MDERGPVTVMAVAAPFGRDVGAGLEQVEQTLRIARERGARLVVFPECALGGYVREPVGEQSAPDLPPALALDGPEVARLVRLAGETVVCIGLTEADGDGRRNTALCVSGDGVLGVHRKVHLPPAERFAYTPGDGFAAFETPVGRLGMVVCYDKLFPEAARALALDGAQAIASLAAWPVDRHAPARRVAADRQTRHFDAIDAARAIENHVTWISSNMTGDWGAVRFLGSAKVVDADGIVRATTGAHAGHAVAEVDLRADRLAVTREVDHLADRRPAAYAAVLSVTPRLAAEPAG
jgi:predicted amidohydrolase